MTIGMVSPFYLSFGVTHNLYIKGTGRPEDFTAGIGYCLYSIAMSSVFTFGGAALLVYSP